MRPRTITVNTNESLSNCIISIDIAYGTDLFFEVMEEALRYITGVCTAFDFQRYIKENIDFNDNPLYKSAKEFRLALIAMKSCFRIKYFCYCLSNYSEPSSRYASDTANTMGLCKNDYRAAWYTLKTTQLVKELKKRTRKNKLNVNDLTPSSYNKATKGMVSIYPSIVKYIKWKTYTKLTFLKNTTNLEYADFEGDLLLKAMAIYYKVMPTSKGEAYVINYIKAGLNNHVNNIIMSFNADKRARLVSHKDKDGNWHSFMREMSESQLVIDEDVEQRPYDHLAVVENTEDIDAFMLSKTQLLEKYRGERMKTAVVKAFLGEYDIDFTHFLVDCSKIKSNEDNVDYFVRDKNETLVQVSLFLDIPVYVTKSFLKIILTDLGFCYKEWME